ncbi:MAG: DNA methyltransferase, partial [Bacteriovoracales bacterium]|nr:DNA methyltransferase [Bacteriovoracales bacterium]
MPKASMKLLQGDCKTLIARLPSKSVDMVLTSPPYDNLRSYNGQSVFSFKDFVQLAAELQRVLKKGGIIVWVVGDAVIKGSESGTSFRQALHFKSIGLRLHDTMIYQKSGFAFPMKNRSHQLFEYMFIF